MAGHSKWHNIQHRKKGQDARRGKLFTKLIRAISVAARHGGGDPASNPTLRTAIDKALSNNMTRDTVDRAIKRGTGEGAEADMFEIRYEGYGPNGVAVMVDCLTDNKNRTVADVRHAFTKCGGNLGTDGSVAYLFTQVGLIAFNAGADEDVIMEAALEAGAEDVVTQEDGSIEVSTAPDEMLNVKTHLVEKGLTPDNAEVTMVAATQVDISTEDDLTKLMRLTEMLEDLDDVQNVYTNADVSDEAMAALDG